MNDKERLHIYLVVSAWNQKKNWRNFVTLWHTFRPDIWFGARLYIIVRNTLNGKYKRVAQWYKENHLGKC